MNAQKYNQLFYSDRPVSSVIRQETDLSFVNFPSTLYVPIVYDSWLESIVVNVTKAYNTGAISISDTAVIVDPSKVDLTTQQSYEIPLWKKYNAGAILTISLTGTPTSGICSIIYKLSVT